jgi:hypothetical protein
MSFEHIQCEQNSEEWFKSRIGKWTASFFAKALSCTGKVSKSASKVNINLIEEVRTGERKTFFQSEAMLRGTVMEPEALKWINDNTEYNFIEVGFFDTGKGYGCSPDAIDFDKKVGLEMKCPIVTTHDKYLIKNILPTKYISQVQGQLMISGYDKWIFMSYHPDREKMIIVVERDEPFISKLREELEKNCEIISIEVDKLKGEV